MKKCKPNKIFVLIILALLILCFFLTLSINLYITSSTSSKMLSLNNMAEHKVDCVLILGAGITDEGNPSEVLKKRLDAGVTVWNAAECEWIIVSGDRKNDSYDEPESMKQYLIKTYNIPSDKIIKDTEGFSTYESVDRAKNIYNIKSMIIVTQKYHLSRALYIADRLDISAFGFIANDIEGPLNFRFETREWAARVKDFFGTL